MTEQFWCKKHWTEVKGSIIAKLNSGRMSRAAELVSVAVWSLAYYEPSWTAVWVSHKSGYLPVKLLNRFHQLKWQRAAEIVLDTKLKPAIKKDYISSELQLQRCSDLFPNFAVVLWVKVHEELKVNSISPWNSSCSSCSFLSRFCLCFLTFSCLVLHASGQRIPGEKINLLYVFNWKLNSSMLVIKNRYFIENTLNCSHIYRVKFKVNVVCVDAPCQRWLWFWLMSPHTGHPTLQPSLGPLPQIPAGAPPSLTCFLLPGEGFCPPPLWPARSAPCQHTEHVFLVTSLYVFNWVTFVILRHTSYQKHPTVFLWTSSLRISV